MKADPSSRASERPTVGDYNCNGKLLLRDRDSRHNVLQYINHYL